ncbi:unnamed protein product [Lepeophtheirus salmonis]|uniref:(salmon louse) hypothetical protein n=1 Tax=Lepeophtheirus salmonis TaxID=72036 RepID=A0A817FDQ5_LEPSM|nr:unnamed protein product [Lepeophtheirus salmonis]CAG9476921.1 unnamed protein product [Lepeophtheirus salmonis]
MVDKGTQSRASLIFSVLKPNGKVRISSGQCTDLTDLHMVRALSMMSSPESTMLSGVEEENELSKAIETSKTGNRFAVSEMASEAGLSILRNGLFFWVIRLVVPTSIRVEYT